MEPEQPIQSRGEALATTDYATVLTGTEGEEVLLTTRDLAAAIVTADPSIAPFIDAPDAE